MGSEKRHASLETEAAGGPPVPVPHRRRRLTEGLRLPALVASVIAVPCVVFIAVSGLDRPAVLSVSPQSELRPEIPDPPEADTDPSPSTPTASTGSAPVPLSSGTGRKQGTDRPRTSSVPQKSPTPPSARPPSATASPRVLSRGDSGPAVTLMQGMLYKVGFYHGHRYGQFDGDTEESVRRFQAWSAVADEVRSDTPGTYGVATRQALTRWAGRTPGSSGASGITDSSGNQS
ncbi:peptidoglycan-binding protein [Streptomyces lavendulae]|uniref:peptidoglycan-binding domain-containing protein n=1 Tax=Streptomyces lavendulae TaxID=1914 RepID=UPI0033CB9D33